MLLGVQFYLTKHGYGKLIVVTRHADVERIMTLWTRIRGMVKIAFKVHPIDDVDDPRYRALAEEKKKNADADLVNFSAANLKTPRR
jgi:hypothetical protein